MRVRRPRGRQKTGDMRSKGGRVRLLVSTTSSGIVWEVKLLLLLVDIAGHSAGSRAKPLLLSPTVITAFVAVAAGYLDYSYPA